MRQVRCTTPDCSEVGVVRDVPDLPVVRGVVHRPALYCAACGTALPDLNHRQPPVEAAVVAAPENAARRTGRPRSR